MGVCSRPAMTGDPRDKCPRTSAQAMTDGGSYTSRAWCTAAAMKPANSGCGSNGFDFSSG